MSRRQAMSPEQCVEAILDAYRRGYFPMAEGAAPWNPSGRRQVHWFSPDPRGVLPLRVDDGFHTPRSVEKALRSGRFMLRVDGAFAEVMRACAAPRGASDEAPDNDQTWIDDTLLRWYTLLHRHGHAHSLEAWACDPAGGASVLVGGIYGVSIGAAFFGESMFCLPRPRRADGTRDPLDGTDASKVCLVTLVRALHGGGYTLFDTQMVTALVRRFGGREIPRAVYLSLLAEAASAEDRWPAALALLRSAVGGG